MSEPRTWEQFKAEMMKNPEFARAYRRAKFWRPVTDRVETLRYWIAYWMARIAIDVCDSGAEDGVTDWWKAYRKRNGIPEDGDEPEGVSPEEVRALAGSRPNWPD